MDGDDLGISTVLPVAEESGDLYELDLPPANGLDYLRRVRLEAKSCPSTVTVELELPSQTQQPSTSEKHRSRSSAMTLGSIPHCSPAPTGYAPTLQWQKQQVADFSKLRMRLSKEVKELRKGKSRTKVKLPKATDVEGWCLLCFGRTHDKVKSEGGEEGDQTQAASTQATATPPLLSIISQIDQDTLLIVLGYHIQWFEVTGFSHLQGQWFYALLASLEKPLLPESCSLIRSLARVCSNLRASLESADDSLLSQLNLIICLVGDYFDQTDLCDVR